MKTYQVVKFRRRSVGELVLSRLSPHDSNGIRPGQSVVTSLSSLPLKSTLGLITVESSSVCREVKHEIGLSVTIYILDVAAMRRSCTATIGNEIGSSEPIPDVRTCRIEILGLQDSNRN